MSLPMTAMIELSNAEKTFTMHLQGGVELPVVRGVSFHVDAGECAFAYIVAGEIAAKSGDERAARRHWQRGMELLAPRLPATRDRLLLDPAARLALHLGRAAEANTMIAQLTQLGYVPLEAWPASNQLDAPKASAPKS